MDEGLIDLDEPLVSYLNKPLTDYGFKDRYESYMDLKEDERYKIITARMCLSHTIGFPNWRYIGKNGLNMKKNLEIKSYPGTNYSYSGEGIQLLQFVIEKIIGETPEKLVHPYVFKPLNMGMTSFICQVIFLMKRLLHGCPTSIDLVEKPKSIRLSKILEGNVI